MKIELEFDEQMTAAVMEGRKCCTFRREKHGEVGDIFEVGGRTYRICGILDTWLVDVIHKFYGAEGFENPDVARVWLQTHYGAAYDVLLKGCLHFFARVPEAWQ